MDFCRPSIMLPSAASLLFMVAARAVAAAPPVFRVVDSSTLPRCFGAGGPYGNQTNQTSPFPVASDSLRFGITPRSHFELVGWKCSVPGCVNNATSISAGTYFFPQILGGGNWSGDPALLRNGGVPQMANLSLQLEHMEAYVDLWLPDPGWSGDSGIDFELWTPIWEEMIMPASVGFHSVRYQNLSIELVRAKHLTWPMERLVAQAKVEFEAAATHWMTAVLSTLRRLRPNARFGYYGIPFNGFGYRGLGSGGCHTAPVDMVALRQRNDQLRPLVRAGGVLYPSIYLNGGYAAKAQRQFVSLVTTEAVRLAEGAPVLPFHWAYFDDDCAEGQQKVVGSGRIPLPAALHAMALTETFRAGGAGLILWDCPKYYPRGAGHDSKTVMDTVVGPTVQSFMKNQSLLKTDDG